MTMQENLNQVEQLKSKSLKQNQGKLYDDCFYIQQKKYGSWYSTDKKGNGLITSLTEDQCVLATRFYLKGLQEGFTEYKIFKGEIGEKL